MDFEMESSRSAQPESHRAILHAGLLQRRADLRVGWRGLLAAECLDQLGSTAGKVVSLLSGADKFHDWRASAPGQWVDCDASLQECLISIGVGENLAYRCSTAGPTPLSCADLKKLSRKARVEALTGRYRYPLNIGVEGESQIAEELLRQLMVADRAKLEAEVDFDAEDVLLKLNLAAIYARIRRDIRFLDALNYFYELPQRSLARLQRNPPFLAGWLCIYAQLLCAPDW